MKQKLLSLLLVCALLVCALPVSVAADNTGLCYTAVNDGLLDLSSVAVSTGGNIFVPASAFSNFGVYYSYFSANNTGMLYNGSKQIFFDLNAGNSYDSYGNYYSAAAVSHNGQVCVPVGWTCQYFGLSYSFIEGIGYGDIIRIKNGNESLQDSKFLEVATPSMKRYYAQYFGPPATPTPTPTPVVTPSPEEGGKAGTATLCFIGLPGTDILEQLALHSYRACFFLTADEASANPDIVRRICGAGHTIGVYVDSKPESEAAAATEAIFSAAQIRPTLLTSPENISKACSDYAASHAYAYYAQRNPVAESTANASAVTSVLRSASGHITITLTCGDGTTKLTPGLVQYLASEKFTVLPLLETGV